MFDQHGLRTIPDGIAKRTLKDIIETRVSLHPSKIATNFLHDGELDSQECCTYSELDLEARKILALMLQAGIKKGDRVLLLFPAGNRFIQALTACLYGAVVAVPFAVPGRKDADWQRIYAMAEDCSATAILSCGDRYQKITHRLCQDKKMSINVPACHCLNVDSVSDRQVVGLTQQVCEEDLAILQYTSGSTASPKGVMVNHASLLHNQRVLQTGFKNDAETHYVSWLPLFHDMGLMGCALQSLYLGVPFNFMTPAAFLQRPKRWLDAISHFRATTSGAPNFAYELCVERYSKQDFANIDLTSWRCAFNGAEPVRESTLDRFQSTYEKHGLCKDAQFPCYGLAEGVLMVTGCNDQRDPKVISIDKQSYQSGKTKLATELMDSARMVALGPAVGNQELAIVCPKTRRRVNKLEVGEVWLHGPSVASGYWGKEQTNNEIFKAVIDGEKSDKAYLRTGDSGFLDEEGMLYITGRLKDTLIINGKNYYPQDIERVVENADPSLNPGGGAVFSIQNAGEEKIVVVHEIRRTAMKNCQPATIIKAIRMAVARECELAVFDVCLLRPTRLLKTTSGKVQRQRNKQAYLDNEPNYIGRLHCTKSADENATLNSVMETINTFTKKKLGRSKAIRADELFVDIGLDSTDSMQLATQLTTSLGRSVSPTLFWQYPEFGEFCQALVSDNPDVLTSDALDELSGFELRRFVEHNLS